MEGNVRESRTEPKVNPSAEAGEGRSLSEGERVAGGRAQELGLVRHVQAAAV